MHEMSVAQNVLEIVHQFTPVQEIPNVRSVRLRIGELAGVVPESLEFCFKVLIEGTPLQGAALAIEHVPLTIRCKNCNTTSKLEFPVFVCPSCNSSDVELKSGTEFHVVEIELQDNKRESS